MLHILLFITLYTLQSALHHTWKNETSKKQEHAQRQSCHLVFIQEGSDSGISLSHKGALIKQLSCGRKRAEVNVYLLTALRFQGVDSFLEHFFVLCIASTLSSRKPLCSHWCWVSFLLRHDCKTHMTHKALYISLTCHIALGYWHTKVSACLVLTQCIFVVVCILYKL